MPVIRVTRNIFAYWQKPVLDLHYGKRIRQFLTEEERWMMGGKDEEFFQAEYDPTAERWVLRSVVPRPGGAPSG